MIYMPLEDIDIFCYFRLYVAIFIDIVMCSNKNHECFHNGYRAIMQGICLHRERYTWDHCILAMMYRDLHSFISMNKGGRTVVHSFILHAWVYEHINIARMYLIDITWADMPHWFLW